MQSDWLDGEINDLLEKIIGGGTPSRKVFSYWGGKIPWASVKDFEDGKDDLKSTEEFITSLGLYHSAANLIPAGIPIICSRMAVGRCAISSVPVAINQDLKAVFPNESVDAKYLSILLQFLRNEFEKKAIGSTVKGISIGDIRKVTVYYPRSKDLQRKIAGILSTCDAVIEKTEAAIAKYQAIKQGMMHDLFTRGIDLTTGQLRPPYEDAPELYKETELGWLPKDWEANNLVEYCERISVGIATSSSKHVRSTGVLFLRNQNIKENQIDLSDILFITKDFAELNRSKYLKKGDVITVRTGYPGISAVVSKELEGAQTFTTLITTPDHKILNSFFLATYINSSFGRAQIFSLQGGGAQQNLNSRALELMKMMKPSIHEQEAIVARFSALNSKIESEKSYLYKYRQLKAGLMQDLLTGKVEVNTFKQEMANG